MEPVWSSLSSLRNLGINLWNWDLPFKLLPGPITDPVAVFLIIMAIMLIAPLLFQRLRMPGIIGLILAGVVVGPYGLGVLERDSTIVLLGTVGLLFLMFMGGLETSLDDLKLNANKAITFGLATFAVPMILGTVAMLALGYGYLAAILVASCFASHTLVALPLLGRLGIMRAPAVTATLGATLITNVLALLVLAVVVKAHTGALTLSFWLFLIPALIIYTVATLWGVPRLGRWFFQRFGHDENAEFTFVLATLFVVSYVAQLIEIEPIVGAFLAGVAITQLIPQLSPLMNRIQFIGNTLFVPFFLISVGMLVDPLILVKEPRSLVVAAAKISAEVLSKFIAAWGSGKIFGFAFPNIMVMFGLSLAQAASTLAAVTVAFEIELVDELTVNGIIAMILVSCVASPWITAHWGQAVKPEAEPTGHRTKQNLGDRVLVPVANPNTEDNLLQLALILAKSSEGTLLPLHVLSDRRGAITPEAKMQQNQLLSVAETIAHGAVAPVEPIGRVDDSIDRGIVRTATERNASVIICGWKGYSTYGENLLGSVLDKVVRQATVPVLVSRFAQPLENTERIILAISEADPASLEAQQTAYLAQSMAEELKAPLQVVRVLVSSRQPRLQLAAVGLGPEVPVQRVRGSLAHRIGTLTKAGDLLILISETHPERFGQSVLGREPEAIARTQPHLSMLIVHFPTPV